jgi:hypothetical protein
MPNETRELKRLLPAADCRFHRRGKGDRESSWSPVGQRFFTTDGVGSRRTANETLEQAGLPKAF